MHKFGFLMVGLVLWEVVLASVQDDAVVKTYDLSQLCATSPTNITLTTHTTYLTVTPNLMTGADTCIITINLPNSDTYISADKKPINTTIPCDWMKFEHESRWDDQPYILDTCWLRHEARDEGEPGTLNSEKHNAYMTLTVYHNAALNLSDMQPFALVLYPFYWYCQPPTDDCYDDDGCEGGSWEGRVCTCRYTCEHCKTPVICCDDIGDMTDFLICGHRCIHKNLVCDGFDNCGDDETIMCVNKEMLLDAKRNAVGKIGGGMKGGEGKDGEVKGGEGKDDGGAGMAPKVNATEGDGWNGGGMNRCWYVLAVVSVVLCIGA